MSVAIEPADSRLLLQVYRMNCAVPKAPFLYWGRQHKRVRALVSRGLLKEHPAKLSPHPKDAVVVTITEAGIDAYNEHLAGAQP
jgi:hypothetical protein